MLIAFASSVGGVSYYRAALPGLMVREALAAQDDVEVMHGGYELDVSPGGKIGVATSRERGVDPHVLVLAGGHPTNVGAKAIADAVKAGQRVIVDVDDWALPEENPHFRETLQAEKIAACRAASAVTCSTPYLWDRLAHELIPSTVIRNRIRPEDFAVEHPDAGDGRLRVAYRGVLGGFHDGDVLELAGEGLDGIEGVEWIHVGATKGGRRFGDLAVIRGVEERRAVPFGDQFPPLLAGVDLAVIPLAPRPFSAAKSNIAALEWSAAGVPWLASVHPEFAALDANACVIRGGWFRALEACLRLRRRDRMRAAQRRALGRWAASVPGGWEWLAVLMPAAVGPSRSRRPS